MTAPLLRWLRPGEPPRPGDLLLVPGVGGWMRAERVADRVLHPWHGGDWGHAAVVGFHDPTHPVNPYVIEARPPQVDVRRLTDWQAAGPVGLIRVVNMTDAQALLVWRYAYDRIGTPYDTPDLLAIILHSALRIPVGHDVNDKHPAGLICSVLAEEALEAAGDPLVAEGREHYLSPNDIGRRVPGPVVLWSGVR